jgi:hypothetical protein
MPDMKTDWSYPVIETTLDKRIERAGVQRGFSSEMTGVDGRSEGGLKPFPGFRKIHTFDQLQNANGHGSSDIILDFKAIDFRIGSEFYGYGFVYRTINPANPTVTCDVFIDYWNSATNTWTKSVQLMSETDSSAQFDVEVSGRFVYLFVSGRSPALFYVEATRTKDYYPQSHVDPNIQRGTTWISEADPNTTKGFPYTTPTTTNRHIQINNTSGSRKRGLIAFNTSAEANKTVESATLTFTITNNGLTTPTTALLKFHPTTTSWEWNYATWNTRTGNVPPYVTWTTPGGDFDAGTFASYTVEKGYLGPVVLDVKSVVQGCLLSSYNPSSSYVSFLVQHNRNADIYIANDNQAIQLWPKLTVTYTDKVFLTPKVIGLGVGSAIPGPGKQPKLTSPERGVAPGSFSVDDLSAPGEAQIIMTSDVPYTSDMNFPDQSTGICSGTYADILIPAPSVPPVPGSAAPCAPSGVACSGSGGTETGFIVQLRSPANRQTNVSATPILDWTAYYTDGSALNANIKFNVFLVEEGKGALDSHCVAVDLPSTTTSYSPASLWPLQKMPYGKKFLWKVVAHRTDCLDFCVSSITGSFTVGNKYEARKFEPGDYSFSYVLVDSKTGRRSALSTIAQIRSEDFLVTRTQGGNSISVKQDQYIGIEISYDSNSYDLLYAYRSVKIQDAGGTMIAGLPFLDAIIKLEDYHSCLNGAGRIYDPSQSIRHAIYFYELEDKQLVYQSPYVDRSVFDEEMPYAGAAVFYQNTMLTSKIQKPLESTSDQTRIDDPHRGLGEMRWSSLVEMSPELFPPFNRYNPTIPGNEVICFSKVGGNVLGFSRDKVYHIRKSGPYLKVTEMHEGYGIVNPKAVDSVGSAAFYVTSHGLKSVDTQGQLDEIRNLNNVMIREWQDDLLSVQVAHDPFMNCLFIHNPVQEETYVLWFSTSKTTKLADTNFQHVTQGSWPIGFTGTEYSNSLCRRAMFLLGNQETRASGTGVGTFAGPAIYVVDQAADRLISGGTASWNGSPRITNLDFAGDSRFLAAGAWGSSITISGATVGTNAWKFCYLYLVSSTANPGNVGKKAKIMHNTSTNVYIDSAVYPWVTATVAGDVFVVSPVPFEWAGHPLSLTSENGMVFSNADLFRMKVISSIGASFTDVSGPPTTDTLTASKPLDRYTGLVYSGTQETPLAYAETKDTNGNLYASVEDDEGVVYAAFGSDASDGRYGVKGNSLTPGIRILCPDLNFRLLGCIVRGSITSVERTTNIRGS